MLQYFVICYVFFTVTLWNYYFFVSYDFVGKIISARAFFPVSVEKGSFFNNGEVG